MNEFSPDAAVVVSPVLDDAGDGRSHLAGRNDQLVKRIATHEAGHAVCARWLGTAVETVTIRPSGGFAGRCVRKGTSLNLIDAPQEAIDIVEVCGRLGPPCPGESRNELAAGLIVAQTLMIELAGGNAAERVMFPDLAPLNAPHDLLEAQALAMTCATASAVAALVAYAEAEALAIVGSNADVVGALANQLAECGELSGDQVDTVIASAIARRQVEVERERRQDWRRRMANAAAFSCERLR
jgi:hypothetical protein